MIDKEITFISTGSFKEFIKKKHANQTDKVGQPYYLHPYTVADNVADFLCTHDEYLELPTEIQDFIMNRAIIVAYCHDLFEDTDATTEDLIKLGADKYVLDALKLLTHDKNTSYQHYVENISTNTIATIVKLADLTHNMDIRRFAGVKTLDEHDLIRLNKYLKSYTYLKDKFNELVKNYEGQGNNII